MNLVHTDRDLVLLYGAKKTISLKKDRKAFISNGQLFLTNENRPHVLARVEAETGLKIVPNRFQERIAVRDWWVALDNDGSLFLLPRYSGREQPIGRTAKSIKRVSIDEVTIIDNNGDCSILRITDSGFDV